ACAERRGRRSALRSFDDARDEIVELQLFAAELPLLAARELDEVGDEARKRVELDRRFVGSPPLLVLRQLALDQQVDVGARRRQWCSQLVRRVRDEPALTADRVFEGSQHAVEPRGEPAKLVSALALDAFGEIAGR